MLTRLAPASRYQGSSLPTLAQSVTRDSQRLVGYGHGLRHYQVVTMEAGRIAERRKTEALIETFGHVGCNQGKKRTQTPRKEGKLEDKDGHAEGVGLLFLPNCLCAVRNYQAQSSFI